MAWVMVSKYPAISRRTSSASIRSARAVEPVISAKRIVTTRRSSVSGVLQIGSVPAGGEIGGACFSSATGGVILDAGSWTFSKGAARGEPHSLQNFALGRFFAPHTGHVIA